MSRPINKVQNNAEKFTFNDRNLSEFFLIKMNVVVYQMVKLHNEVLPFFFATYAPFQRINLQYFLELNGD